MMRHLRRGPRGRRRSFEAALRYEADLSTAQGVVVVNADGSLTVLAGSELDRSAMAEQLVALAFDQATRHDGAPSGAHQRT